MLHRHCPVCNSEEADFIENIQMNVPEIYHLPSSYNIVVCKNCGMVYADTAATMEDYDWYYTHCNFYGDDSKDDNSERYDWVESLLECYLTKEAVMLELGAGNGRYEVDLKAHGYNYITGTDPSEESVERLLAAGVDAYVANIYSDVPKQEYGKYDAVFLFEVAEHLLKPRRGISNVALLLKDNGYFMLSVPDYSMIAEDTNSIPNYFNLEHINYFSENSLDYLMAQYHMKRVDHDRVGADLIQDNQKTKEKIELKKDLQTQIAVKRYLENQKKRTAEIESIIDKLCQEQNELVIWGTGSFVMSLFATTSLKNYQIVGFVDNNKIKQGREIYGYKINNHEYLKDKECTVLICSMLYGNQIKEQIEEMHTKNKIIVL